ncbi:hypothetical protein [Sutcliffiella horikoshii]|uniref:hypothetical protein n=1 Tax=Sutcliffiella horikoshii TaxID=79883 RepID=UPI001F3BFFE3|nr:hypothetical protein [Sutcliffiella horikoshii]MCG1021978.1 hypothetical protein [Sutcliffiella horikoshii]
MDYIDQNIFPLFLVFLGVMLIVAAITSFLQKGVSTVSTSDRFQGILITGFVTLGLIWFTTSQENWDGNLLYFTLGPLLVPLAMMFMQRKKDEIHIEKYVPQDVMNILERNLKDKGYSYKNDVIANEEYISSNYITMYYLDDPHQTIKIKWKDLEISGLEVEFQHFPNKDFIKEVVGDLRDERPPINFLKFKKISLSFAAVAIFIGVMQLLGF